MRKNVRSARPRAHQLMCERFVAMVAIRARTEPEPSRPSASVEFESAIAIAIPIVKPTTMDAGTFFGPSRARGDRRS